MMKIKLMQSENVQHIKKAEIIAIIITVVATLLMAMVTVKVTILILILILIVTMMIVVITILNINDGRDVRHEVQYSVSYQPW